MPEFVCIWQCIMISINFNFNTSPVFIFCCQFDTITISFCRCFIHIFHIEWLFNNRVSRSANKQANKQTNHHIMGQPPLPFFLSFSLLNIFSPISFWSWIFFSIFIALLFIMSSSIFEIRYWRSDCSSEFFFLFPRACFHSISHFSSLLFHSNKYK